MEHAVYSDYMGFACDTTEISDEIAAVTNTLDEYRRIVMTGMATEEQYQEFIDKLHAVGADKIVAFYQKQLDNFLASR